MYCDIKLGNLEIFTLFFHFPYRSYLYSGKQEKHGAYTWKIFSVLGRSNKQVKFSLILAYSIVCNDILIIFVFFIKVIELG